MKKNKLNTRMFKRGGTGIPPHALPNVDCNDASAAAAVFGAKVAASKHDRETTDWWIKTASYPFKALGEALGEALKGTNEAFKTIEFGKTVVPPLVAILLLGIIIAVIFGNINLSKSDKSGNVNKPTRFNYLNPFSLLSPFMPTYKMKIFGDNFDLYGKKADTSISDRPIMTIGRCDNLKNYQITSKKSCMATSTPEPIIWTLDVNKMPELEELELSIDDKDRLFTNKSIVSIPWEIYNNDGMNYYPNCSKAMFIKTDGTIGDSAAHLFKDNGIRSCEKKTIARTTYQQP